MLHYCIHMYLHVPDVVLTESLLIKVNKTSKDAQPLFYITIVQAAWYDLNSYNFLTTGSKGEADKKCKIFTPYKSAVSVEKPEHTGDVKRKRKANKKSFADYVSTAEEDSCSSAGMK